MNEWTILLNKLILDVNSMSKLTGQHVTKIVYVYDQAFKVGVVGNLVSTLDILNKCGAAHAKKIFAVQQGIFT